MPNHPMQWIGDLEDLIIQVFYNGKYLESQRNYYGGCMTFSQRFQFEWIVIGVDSSIQIRL